MSNNNIVTHPRTLTIGPKIAGVTRLQCRLKAASHKSLDASGEEISCQPAPFLYTLYRMSVDVRPAPRRSDRKPIRKAIVLMVESDEQEVRHDGVAVDMSEHGSRIMAEAPLMPGQTISLIQPDDPAHALRCLAVWSGDVSSDGNEQAGLEFLNQLSGSLDN